MRSVATTATMVILDLLPLPGVLECGGIFLSALCDSSWRLWQTSVLCCFPSVHGDSNRHLLLSFKLRCLFLGLAKAVDGFLGVVIFIVFPQRLVLRVGGLSCESLCASVFGIDYDSCMVFAEFFVPRFCVCVCVHIFPVSSLWCDKGLSCVVGASAGSRCVARSFGLRMIDVWCWAISSF